MSTESPKQIRIAAGLSITAAAALANVSPNTYRAFELDRLGVTDKSRRACDSAVERLAGMAKLVASIKVTE
jgi:hypothetical protein